MFLPLIRPNCTGIYNIPRSLIHILPYSPLYLSSVSLMTIIWILICNNLPPLSKRYSNVFVAMCINPFTLYNFLIISCDKYLRFSFAPIVQEYSEEFHEISKQGRRGKDVGGIEGVTLKRINLDKHNEEFPVIQKHWKPIPLLLVLHVNEYLRHYGSIS